MPLAIELVAPWVRLLPLPEISRKLMQNLDLLASSLRDVPPRHRSMRAAFDSSWRLLTSHERAVLRRCSIFRGGFSAEAAQRSPMPHWSTWQGWSTVLGFAWSLQVATRCTS